MLLLAPAHVAAFLLSFWGLVAGLGVCLLYISVGSIFFIVANIYDRILDRMHDEGYNDDGPHCDACVCVCVCVKDRVLAG